MAENRKVQKSEQTILKEKFERGEISLDTLVKRTRELAREKVASTDTTKLEKEIERLNGVIKNMTNQTKELENTYEAQIADLKGKLDESGQASSNAYTNYEELKAYLDTHLLLVEAVDPRTNKRLITNVIVRGETEPHKNYYVEIAMAMTGMVYGSQLVLDKKGILTEKWSLRQVNGEQRLEFLESLVDKLYSCELCKPSFGEVPTFISLGNRNDCSLYAEDFDWYFEEQEQYIAEEQGLDSFDCDFEDEDCEGCSETCGTCKCECDKETKETEKKDAKCFRDTELEDLVGALMLARLIF